MGKEKDDQSKKVKNILVYCVNMSKNITGRMKVKKKHIRLHNVRKML